MTTSCFQAFKNASSVPSFPLFHNAGCLFSLTLFSSLLTRKLFKPSDFLCFPTFPNFYNKQNRLVANAQRLAGASRLGNNNDVIL